MSTPTRYHPALVTLHWLMAIVILLTLAVGGSLVADTPNADPAKIGYLRIHMAIGIALGALILLRWFVRAATAKPPEADAGHPMLTLGGRLVHWGFYVVVIAMLASANADPAKFDQPEALDLRRHPNPHVSFGTGIHVCLGMKLARLEGALAFERLFTRYPSLRLAQPRDQVQWTSRIGMRALSTLPIELVA